MGAEPIVADIYDLDAMTSAMSGADTLLHLATRIPPIEQGPRSRRRGPRTTSCARSARRCSSTPHSPRASTASWPSRSRSSIATVAPSGSTSVRKSTPGPHCSRSSRSKSDVARFSSGGGAGVVLRFGGFYGADARGTDEFLKAARRHVAPALGPPDGYVSSIHTGDAASAVVAALDAPAGSTTSSTTSHSRGASTSTPSRTPSGSAGCASYLRRS